MLFLALRLEIFAGSSNCLMNFSPSVFGWRWIFFSLGRSTLATTHSELDATAASSCPKIYAAGVVLVTLSESRWHRFPRLESLPAWYSGGGAAWWSMSAFLSLSFLTISPEQWTGLCFTLIDVSKDAPARLQMLDSEGFPSAEETDKLQRVSVVWVMMVTNSVRCVRLSLVNDLFVFR